ncbi:MAG: sugar transferase [Rhodothermales bacterium]|nr:sugar transferase [Rhodothermales bacterium]
MSRRTELIFLLLTDAAALVLAHMAWYWARFEWGWTSDPVFMPSALLGPVLVLTVFWHAILFLLGLYRERYAASRFDELVTLAKAVTVGILALFFLLFVDSLDYYSARLNLATYWIMLFGFVATSRVLLRSVQKSLILKGKGLHRALIVGWSDILDELHEEVARYPEAGLKIVGGIRLIRGDGSDDDTGADGRSAGSDRPAYVMEDLPRLIDELDVQDVLIALGPNDSESLMEVLRLCDGKPVRLKLVPDFYSIIGGMARTEHMYGLPLIEVLPEPMQVWEQTLKRLLDLVISTIVLVVGLPVWLLVGILIRLTSQGPAIYRQKRIGRHGREFTMYKFRTMREDAEASTGPVWAQENDPRYTPVGRWLRRWRLDEIPQFWNVLKGDMSLVGPRPERPYFVEKLANEVPLYNRRHRVKPGITGWAQVKWKYDSSLDDVKQKVKYDLFYIENMSLRRDLQILFRTIYTAVRGTGQ